MKKFILFLAFFGAFAFTSNAQSCNKTASANKSCCAKTAAAAAKLASNDATIEAKTCSKSGKVSYYKNYTCSVSGKMTSTEVSYDAKTAKFVNVSPSAKEAAAGGKNAKKTCAPKAGCTKKAAKATKSVKAVKTSSATKKSCDPKKCAPSSCKKGVKASNAKLVKAEN